MSIGKNVVQLEKLIQTPMIPPPNWARKWQTEAQHILHLAHQAKDSGDLEKLKMLDDEAVKMVAQREARLKKT